MSGAYRAGTGWGEAARRACGVAAWLAVAPALGGCSFALPSLLGDAPAETGSVRAAPASSPLSPDLDGEDWRRARAALGVAMDPQGSGAAVRWDNPDTGFGGAFTPVAQPFVKGGDICRVFLATVGRGERTSSLQGTACRRTGDEWDVKAIEPARKPG